MIQRRGLLFLPGSGVVHRWLLGLRAITVQEVLSWVMSCLSWIRSKQGNLATMWWVVVCLVAYLVNRNEAISTMWWVVERRFVRRRTWLQSDDCRRRLRNPFLTTSRASSPPLDRRRESFAPIFVYSQTAVPASF